jgi:hypothetical protein
MRMPWRLSVVMGDLMARKALSCRFATSFPALPRKRNASMGRRRPASIHRRPAFSRLRHAAFEVILQPMKRLSDIRRSRARAIAARPDPAPAMGLVFAGAAGFLALLLLIGP